MLLAATLPVLASAPFVAVQPIEPPNETTIELPYELKRICSCESTGSPDNEPVQFNADGSVLKGRINNLDTGMCQINLKYWGDTAQGMGFDLDTRNGNALMAIWIYDHYGSQPWFWSRQCWQ